MNKVTITHEGGAEHGPMTIRKTMKADGTLPAGSEAMVVLRTANEQHTFELEDGMSVSVDAGDGLAEASGGIQGRGQQQAQA